MIKSSVRIRRARCLRPVAWEKDGTPIYYNGEGPSIQYHEEMTFHEHEYYGSKSQDITYLDPQHIQHCEDDFATSPRCQMLHACVSGSIPGDDWHCVIYNKNGVRIQDVMAVKASLIKSCEKSIGPWLSKEVDMCLNLSQAVSMSFLPDFLHVVEHYWAA